MCLCRPIQKKRNHGVESCSLSGSGRDRQEATVVSVGPGGFTSTGSRIPIDLKPKDRVIINQFAGQQIGEESERFFLVRQDTILCKLI
jgi:chaperonin GroES